MLAGLVLWSSARDASAADLDLRLRIAWGGAQRSTWSGSITIDKGQLADMAVLGIENDVPGCVWMDRNVIHIREGTARDYGGVDISVVAPEDAKLTIRLRSDTSENEAITETDLVELVDGAHRTPLDEAGNYLLVTRAPGDRMRVTIDRPHVLYAPGETIVLRARVSPELLANQNSLQLVAEVTGARGGNPLHEQASILTPEELAQKSLPVPLPAPLEEGVYEARLVLRRLPSFRDRIVPGAPIVERRIQFVVFDSSVMPLTPAIEWKEMTSVDLANPNWAARLPKWWGLERLPYVPERPPSNVPHQSESILGRSALVLPSPPSDGERSWCAVPLTIGEPGTPHLVTIDLPTGRANQVGLSILEPNAAGFVYPVTRDFGVFSRSDSGDDEGAWLTRRFLFWPRTTSPMVLLANEHPDQAAQIGVLRLYQANVRETAFAESLPSEDRRIAAVLVDRPWLVESLGAPEALDAANNQSVDDWQSFYDAATRLVDYVQLGGYNAAVLSIFADGSTIYPSDVLQSTPRYDTGILASAAPDPVRKDFVELLLSAFERAGLFVYLGLEFSTPLPELEKLRRQTVPQQSGIEWIGADGRSWSEQRGAAGGAAPQYNLLNEKVQQAILDVVREVVLRYNAHSSLRGVAIQLSGNGYAQLLEPHWGFDDNTIARFTKDTGIAVPGSGPQRFAAREAFLLREKRKEWIAWRAGVVSRFYAQVVDEVRSANEQRELLMLPTRLFERAELRGRLRPSLFAQTNIVQVLLEAGLDVPSLAKEEGFVFVRPTFDVPLSPLGSVAAEHLVNSSTEIDAALGAGGVVGTMDYFPSLTRNRRLASFDRQGHFGAGKSFTAPLTQMRPLGHERRRALARALAARDVAVFVEGGQTLVTEMDDDQRRALEIFRKLPSGNCETSQQPQQPLTIRTYRTERDLFVCLVNESAWTHTATVSIEAPAGTLLLELGTVRAPRTVQDNPPRLDWNVEIPGYGIHAARISSDSARVVKTQVQQSGAMKAELTRRIEDLNVRTKMIAADRPLNALQNPAFEETGGAEAIAGWQALLPHGGRVELSGHEPREGKYSACITSAGPTVSLASHAFASPSTGRLELRISARRGPSERCRVRMIIEDIQGGVLYRSHGILSGMGEAGTSRIGTQWQPYRLSVDDVPVESPFPLRVRFEVYGEGSIWIDSVQLFDLSFRSAPSGARGQPNEQLELIKIIHEAQTALEEGAYSDCLESLEGYWPRFLAAHVKVPAGTERIAETPSSGSAPEKDREARLQSVPDRIKQLVAPILKQ